MPQAKGTGALCAGQDQPAPSAANPPLPEVLLCSPLSAAASLLAESLETLLPPCTAELNYLRTQGFSCIPASHGSLMQAGLQLLPASAGGSAWPWDGDGSLENHLLALQRGDVAMWRSLQQGYRACLGHSPQACSFGEPSHSCFLLGPPRYKNSCRAVAQCSNPTLCLSRGWRRGAVPRGPQLPGKRGAVPRAGVTFGRLWPGQGGTGCAIDNPRALKGDS